MKQIEANRRNAQKSTGPRTPTGKQTVSHNAVQHALSSVRPTIFPEEQERYDLFAERLRYEHQPQTAIEELLVEQVIDYAWRLRRIPAIESSILRSQITKQTDGADQLDIALGRAFQLNAGTITRLSRHERGIERALFRSLLELQRQHYARGMNCDPFYVANMGKFPALDDRSKRKEEGGFRSAPDLPPDASDRRLAQVLENDLQSGDIGPLAGDVRL